MKTILLAAFLIAGTLTSLPGQSSEPASSRILTSQSSQAPRLPRYLVYRHFLAWIDLLEKQASAAGATDPYSFAEPFARSAGLSHDEVDVLRGEAKAMLVDLHIEDRKAATAIAAFRAQAKAGLESGQSLPAVPSAVPDLQRERSALLVQHFVRVRTALNPATAAALDSYLDRESFLT